MPTSIINYFGSVRPYKKSNPIQIGLIKDFVFFNVKAYMLLSTVESPWLRQNGIASLCQIQFLFNKQLIHEHLCVLLHKTMEVYMFPTIGQCTTLTTTFDLWMSRLRYDTFVLVINFIH